jgi:hypothetical protein
MMMTKQGRLLASGVQPFMLLPQLLQELRPLRLWTYQLPRNNLLLLWNRLLRSRTTQREPEAG